MASKDQESKTDDKKDDLKENSKEEQPYEEPKKVGLVKHLLICLYFTKIRKYFSVNLAWFKSDIDEWLEEMNKSSQIMISHVLWHL